MTKRALVSAIRPSRSTEAIAIGVLLKKRAKRISAMRPASRSSPGRMSRTSVRDAPIVPSGATGTRWISRTGSRVPSVRTRSMSSVFGFAAVRIGGLQDGEALDRHDVANLRGARLELGEVDADPFGERGVHVADAPVGLEREEAGRRVVEIVDRVLQLLEDVLLVLALARDVGDEPADARFRPARRD